jgi:hypothetical protein
VLISRCAWHRRNYGHGKLLGVARWRGLRIDFTDGICEKCAARLNASFRRMHVGPPAGRGARATTSAGRRGGQTSETIVVALAVATGLLLIAHPTNDSPAPLDAPSVLPRTVAFAPPPGSEQLTRPPRARRAGAGRATMAPGRSVVREAHQSP